MSASARFGAAGGGKWHKGSALADACPAVVRRARHSAARGGVRCPWIWRAWRNGTISGEAAIVEL